MKTKQFLFFALVMISAVFTNACKSKVEEKEQLKDTSVTALDCRDKEITLDAVAQRIVVLYDPLVDDIYMLGAQDKLVGIPQQVYQKEDTFSFLSKLDRRIANKEIATPSFGGGSSNIESIIGLQPDLVITFDKDIETVEQLEQLGIKVYTVSSKSQEIIYKELVGMATLLGKKERAEEIVTYIRAEVAKMQSAKFENPKTAYYAWSKGRVLSTSGKGTLMDLAINLSGAVNACPLEMEAPNVGAETLYKWNPDIIILWDSSQDDVYSLKELENLPAVKNKHVYEMYPTFYYDPHTVKFLLFAKQVRNWCYNEMSADELNVEIQEVLKKLYEINN